MTFGRTAARDEWGGKRGLPKSYFRKYLRSAIRTNYGTCFRIFRTGGRGKRGGTGGQGAGSVHAIRKLLSRKWRRRGKRRRRRISYCRSSATRLVIGAATCKCKLPTPARVFQKATSRPPPVSVLTSPRDFRWNALATNPRVLASAP